MSDLRPRGTAVVVEGEERYLLFTLNVIDDIQDHFDLSMPEVINRLSDKRKAEQTLRYLFMALVNDEAERRRHFESVELKTYTEQEIGWIIDETNREEYALAILEAYGLSLPEIDEDWDPNRESGQMKK